MAVIVLCSATGSPGVTTLGVGLTLHWSRDVVLIDADRHPAQAVLAGYLQGADAAGRGLGSIAQAHRARRDLGEELLAHCIPLSADADEDVRRAFLPGFAHPAAVGVFGPVWADLMAACLGLDEAGTDVIVDAGRLGADGLPPGLVGEADLVLLTVRSGLRSLAAARLYLPALEELADVGSGSVGLALVGAGRPYSRGEIERQFGVEVLVDVPLDPAAAAVYSDGAEPTRKHDGSFVRSLRAAASGLAGRIDERRRQIVGAA